MNPPNFGAIFSGIFGQTQPAPATAPAPGSSPRLTTNVPSPTEIARVLSGSPAREVYVINATDTIEVAFSHLEIVSGLIYCFGSVNNGVLQDAAGVVYLGRTPQHLGEIRGVGDQNVPVLIPETSKSELQEARYYVRGTAGDQLLLVYRR